MRNLTADPAASVLADPMADTDENRLHAALAQLRVANPVAWVDVPGYSPFWAIAKYADIMAIERNNTGFTKSSRPVLTTIEGDEQQAAMGFSTLIHMDEPPASGFAGDRRRLVPTEGHARVEGSRRRVGPSVRRPDGRGRRI